MDSPSGRVPERAREMFLVDTKSCSGGTPDLGLFLGFWGFIGGVGVGRAHKTGAPSTLMDGSGLFWPNYFTPGASFGPSKIIKNWHANWRYSFSVILKNKEKTETGTGF